MVSPDLIAIILFCITGCGLTAYHLGRRVGIEDAVEHMVQEGLLEVVDEE
jgi:hypothetical protein|tara:strand:- start:45 stop:194 length:150 start_codon:yes stop_codon:yes gene_type:complete